MFLRLILILILENGQIFTHNLYPNNYNEEKNKNDNIEWFNWNKTKINNRNKKFTIPCSASIYPHRARRVFFHSLRLIRFLADENSPSAEIWRGTRESRIRARRIVASLCIGRCSRVGSQVKRVNAAALYLRPGHVRLPDYITARGNPEHSWWTPSVANCVRVLRPLTFRPLARGD